MVSVMASREDLPEATIRQAAAGDAAALARIVARYDDDLARVCTVICGGDVEAAADAVQSAWLTAWRRLGSLREPVRLRHWLVAIAANEARQQQRRERRRSVLEIRVAATRGATAPMRHREAELADLSVALRRLEPDERALLALRYLADFDSDQIGRTLGISASGARTRLGRLLARLRTELGDGQ
jgi:RNA polymerase sigma factor (sigma-70 family)